jgi:tetratricopeptide (TPR) repeat protein
MTQHAVSTLDNNRDQQQRGRFMSRFLILMILTFSDVVAQVGPAPILEGNVPRPEPASSERSLRSGQHRAGPEYVDSGSSPAIAANTRDDNESWANGLVEEARLHISQNRLPEALSKLIQAERLRSAFSEISHVRVMTALTVVYAQQLELAKSAEWYARVLAFCDRPESRRNPDTAVILTQIAQLPFVRGQYDSAARLYTRAIELADKLPGPAPAFLVHALEAQGQCLLSLGRFTEARKGLERGYKLSQRMYGSEHVQALTVGAKLALSLLYAGQVEAAYSLAAECTSKLDILVGEKDMRLGMALMAQALIAARLGRFEETELLLIRAVKVGDRYYSPDHPEMIQARRKAAELMQLVKRKDRARQLLAEAESAERKLVARQAFP